MKVPISQGLRNTCKAQSSTGTQQTALTANMQTEATAAGARRAQGQLPPCKASSSISLLSKLLESTGDMAGSRPHPSLATWLQVAEADVNQRLPPSSTKVYTEDCAGKSPGTRRCGRACPGIARLPHQQHRHLKVAENYAGVRGLSVGA